MSGSIPHLERKEVAAIVGGDQAALKEHRDVLDAFSKSITYMGKSGNGLIMKLVTNHILNIHHSGMAEGLAFGMKAGLTAPRMMKFLQEQRDSPAHPLQGHDDGGARLFQRHRELRA